MAIAMPNLNLLMSIGTILLLGYWFYHPGPKQGLQNLKKNKIGLVLIGLFLLHVLWLFNTKNYDYAAHDLRIKLPLLAFGLVLGSIRISKLQVKIVLLGLSLGIWFASIQSYINYADFVNGLHDYRQIVQGISHIRLSLHMVILIAGIIYFWNELNKYWKAYALLATVNVLVFFNVLQSLTGLAALIALIALSVVFMLVKRKKKILLAGFGFGSLAALGAVYFFSLQYYEAYFTTDENPEPTEQTTALGNPYVHDNQNRVVENKHYIYTYVSRKEMVEAWNTRSDLRVDLEARENMNLVPTLIRYLASKGLRKDHDGVMALSESDVKYIEIGFPSVLYIEKSGLALRLHTFIFSVHLFHQTGNAAGLSFFQRVVYWRIAYHLIKKHFWLGTGTGDLRDDFESMYELHAPDMDPDFRLRAHNQFLTFFATFGILGFLYFVSMFLIAFKKRGRDYLALSFYAIALLSCLVEDTLETQAGVTLFAFFFVLFSQPLLDKKQEALTE